MKRTFKSYVPDSSDSTEEKKTTDGDECGPQEQAGLRALEPENFSGSIETSFEEFHDVIIENDSIAASPSAGDFSPPPFSVSVLSAPSTNCADRSSSSGVVAEKNIPLTLLRQRVDSTREGPDGTEPHHSGFGKETNDSESTEGAEPQSASQATEDVQEKHERVLSSASDDEEEEISYIKPLNRRTRISSSDSSCSQNTRLEKSILSSSTRFDSDLDLCRISTISIPQCCIIKRIPNLKLSAKMNSGSRQRTSEKVNPPVAAEDCAYIFNDKLLDLSCQEEAIVEAQETEMCGRPTREHHHPRPVPEDNSSSLPSEEMGPSNKYMSTYVSFFSGLNIFARSSSECCPVGPIPKSNSSCEDMVKFRSIKFNEWKPEVITETDGTEEDDNKAESFSELSNEKMDLYEPAEAVRSSINPHLVQALGSGFSRTHVRPPRPHSCSSVTQETPADINVSTRAVSLPNMKLQSSFEEFTPDFTDDEDDEVFRFRCAGPGLYQCRETGLVFDMKAEGDVFYRMVPWNRRLLSQHHKKPAGPLFDLTCQQQSVAQLHLPHCELRSTGGGDHLSVAHIERDDLELIRPERITETHVVVNITGFSAFGNVKDEDSPRDPVRALVLLFYKLLDEPDADYLINVLLLPKNVAVRDVLRFRKKLDRDETFLETPPHCKLQPQQVYSLSTGSGDDSVLVQPTEAEFDQEFYNNYLPTFQVVYKTLMKHMKLFLRDSSSTSVWERRVCLSSSGTDRSCGSTRQNLRPDEQLSETRISFIDGVSGPVLQSLLDKLLERKVLSDSEREAAEEERNRRDKARFVIDTVRRKGDAAASEMIHFLCELDPFLAEHLGLM